ncbi:hypothetical protein [Rubinisphaera italica]|uniref:Universal stress protein family protein n=1 Tax=Rubinisphaera italica TaxID=2527969 RepID=A0A5C5XC07_9PLAN|nr:hypothetical protein [Rubinisphaera italica]TWT59833.1 hypothetical protein Pan54_05440 [Rubinisphaera italica]
MDTLENLDEFESIFRRATKPQYEYLNIVPRSILIVTDQVDENLESLIEQLKTFSKAFRSVEKWETLRLDDQSTVAKLERQLLEQSADMIVTWRHLCEKSIRPQHSLGVYVDVLTQVLPVPILLLPGSRFEPVSLEDRTCSNVIVVTDHLNGDHRLVNYAAGMVNNDGKLILGHVEDDLVFGRYLKAIEQIPELSTNIAREKLLEQLMHEAKRYSESAAEVLSKISPSVSVIAEIQIGHRLKTYRDLISSYRADLLVMNTKDDEQLAMHGLAYSLSVELIEVPQLLL